MVDALIAVRAVHVAASVAAAGAVLFRLWVASPALRDAGASAWRARFDRQINTIAWSSLAVLLVSAVAWLLLVAVEAGGQVIGDVFGSGALATLLATTRFGHVWIVRIAIALVLGIYLLRAKPHPSPLSLPGCAAAALAAGLLGTLALAGHGGATPGAAGIVHLIADVTHAIAAGVWVGGLLPLALLLAAARRTGNPAALAPAREATRRFSNLAIVSVATLLASGIVNTVFLVGDVPALLGTRYGQLLLLKIFLFAAMVAIAAVNRLKLTPQLFAGPAVLALLRLQRNASVEAALGLGVIAIVGTLGTIPPALHVEPWWPLPFRVELVRPFIVPAFPTSFYRSPTNFTFAAIARGQALFAQHCASCHGASGRGNGPNALALDMPTSDLTAAHVYAHSDGDLFWFIGHGMGDTMPGFGDAIDDQARWNLIDFIHANADAARLQRRAPDEPNAFPAPSFTADCPDGGKSLEDFRGRFVRLVAADRAPPPPAAEIVTILVPLDGAQETAGACTLDDPDATAALAVYRGEAQTLAGTQLLIDPEGHLRALGYPGRTPDWNDPGALAVEIAALRATPALGRPTQTGGHVHVH